DALSDPAIGGEPVPQADLDALAARPAAARAVLALARTARLARDEAGAVALPGGRRIRVAADEVRQVYQERGNHFPALEAAAEAMRERLGGQGNGGGGPDPYPGHAVAERLRSTHGYVVRVGEAPADGMGMHDHAGRALRFSDRLPRESRVFRMAFQLATLEEAAAIDRVVAEAAPSSLEAETTIRVGLANYVAAALLMPYAAFAAAARELRYDLERLATRFGVSFEQAAQRASTLQWPGQKGIALFFASLDAAANVTKSVSLCGFPIAQHGGSCPRWVANIAFTTPGRMQVQVAELPDGERFLCAARTVAAPARAWGDVVPMRAIAIGCAIGDAGGMVYGDGIDLQTAAVAVGPACRMCDWEDCRQRAHPRLAHRLPGMVGV
ncbi:MAG: DUF2083 domain-containing protein, partial [Gluconacetobacter diazotrophicus]|nr:DUF2083 domain-containing protein [Gluconacetobacter diazotrophicus]